ncbi:serine/threonine-protein kinase [Acaryochloris sp. IP29b_bin.148]|uniref:serine/threonine-protein kinase n=1 Tax=Acaryochloris sp. IP29b_bin.148 TaxID=2969218 RepID=UPI0026310422|nr:serine/threonine-protein kinase [Acaryochloris sp. IP29b_bin.148]
MSYCLNPACTNPNNAPRQTICQACGSKLVLRDRYRSTRILGRGGFATTFLAEDEGLPGKPTCVIKQLRPVVTAPHILEMSRELFQREAETLGKIGNHPQLPRLLDYFDLDQEFFLVQEYVKGATLQQEVRRSGPFDESMVYNVLEEVLPLLEHLHGREVIHRDIKPANIIRREIDDKLVLIDFGAVKDQVNQTAIANPDEHSTLTSFAVGTPGFAPPEQMAMRPVYASDIYSLGVTCIYLLTGKSPKDLSYNPVSGDLSWREHVRVSPDLQDLLGNMLEVSLRDRYRSAREVLQALTKQSPYSAGNSSGIPVSQPPNRSPSGARSYSPTRPRSHSPSARSASRIRQYNNTRSGAQPPLTDSFSKVSGHLSTPRSTYTGLDSSSSLSSKGRGQARLTPNAIQHAYGRGQRDFSGQDLRNLNLRKFQLPSANFHEGKFQNTDLRDAILINANFGRANFSGANLRNANLMQAYMSHADLANADLRGANLSDAYLSHANLRGANLCGADLSGAKLTESQLSFAQTNWLTVYPNGKRGKKGRC